MIDKIRDYIATCPYLDEFVELNVNYLKDKAKAYSVNENAGYNPVINSYLNGDKEMQFLFSFDAKFYWNNEIQNNVDNSIFFEKFRDWLKDNYENDVYPDIKDIQPLSISAITNGFIFATNADEAIYRISCKFTYIKFKKEELNEKIHKKN